MLRFFTLTALLLASTTASPAAAQVLHGRVTDAAELPRDDIVSQCGIIMIWTAHS